MKAGLVPYRDLFDHKGLYLYMTTYFAALISDTTTVGMYIVEVIFAWLDLMLFYLLAKIWLPSGKKICHIFISVVMLGIYLNYFTYQGGG